MKRENWVDACKGIAIIAVVIGHLDYEYPEIRLLPISTLIAWLWHVAVFFMIGGFFLKEERLLHPKSFIWGKVKKLYLPILYLYIPAILLHNYLIDIGYYNTSIEYGGKHVAYWSFPQYLRGLAEAVFCAGREPILGAMWFVYVLFMSLCFISFTFFLIKGIGTKHYNEIRCIVLLLAAIAANFLTNIYGFTIPRFNNVFTAAWLIYVGMLLVQRYKVSFDNTFVFVICLFFFYSFAVLLGDVHLNRNEYRDVASLTISTCSAMYIVAYISKKCHGIVMDVLSVVGRESFYIMGLHFIAFKFGSLFLNLFNHNKNIALLNPECGNMAEYFYYLFCGVTLPMLFIVIFRGIKTKMLKAITRP